MRKFFTIIATMMLGIVSLFAQVPQKMAYQVVVRDADGKVMVKKENGVLPGKFSVSDTKKVQFAMGNLQYQASTKKWRFAENQYDVIGDDNKNISATYSGWIDLFGWGTSGWESGANAYQPYSTSTSSSDYYPGGKSTNNLTGDYAQADWGVYNAISNGGNEAGMWRTLTFFEWYYIFNSRTNARSLRSQAVVNGVNGYLLLPDGWTTPSGLSFTAQASDFTTNVYDKSAWSRMESNGAVFLPCAGVRDGLNVYSVGSYGYYWTSSADGSDFANYVYFFSSYARVDTDCLFNGYSVRLATE